MNVTPLALHSPRTVRDMLRSRGWEEGQAAAAASGVHPAAYHLSDLEQSTLEALVPVAGRLGLEVITGDSWAILAGSRARLSTLARPWTLPEPLAELAVQVGLAIAADEPAVWLTARGPVPLDRPVLMGILNLTPDSFSDGGRIGSADAALHEADRLLAAGAALLDLGGESTRPGRSEGVPAAEELDRVLPALKAIVKRHPSLVLSVDTVKAEVAAAALDAGAGVVNDVTAFRLDPAMAATVARARAGAILMHSRGSLLEIASYTHAEYAGNVTGAVLTELRAAVAASIAAGVAPEAIVVDPGFGFSKTVDHNLALLDQLGALLALGRPILVGPSRKRFLGAVTGLAVGDRDRATAAACALAYERGARLFRVHAVDAAREALAVAHAVATGAR